VEYIYTPLCRVWVGVGGLHACLVAHDMSILTKFKKSLSAVSASDQLLLRCQARGTKVVDLLETFLTTAETTGSTGDLRDLAKQIKQYHALLKQSLQASHKKLHLLQLELDIINKQLKTPYEPLFCQGVHSVLFPNDLQGAPTLFGSADASYGSTVLGEKRKLDPTWWDTDLPLQEKHPLRKKRRQET
jgi:hypothetical protein